MILSYSHNRFPDLIKHNIKIHTIRLDRTDRWKIGMKIQHWMHSPRNPSNNPYPFLQDRGDRLISKQMIEIEPDIQMIRIEGRFLSDKEMDELAFNDGLENKRILFKWFKDSFKGWILHWTDKKY